MVESNAAISEPEYEQSELGVLVARLLAHRRFLVIAVVISTALFVAAAYLTTPVYRASVVLVPAGQERSGISGAISGALGQLGGLAALAGFSPGSADAATEEALAVLRSRQFNDRLIAEFNLAPILYADRWDNATHAWKKDAKVPTQARAFKRFTDLRTIADDKKTGMITVSIDWTDRNQAANWANMLASKLNAEMRARAIVQVDESMRYLEKELTTTSTTATREAINRIIEAQMKQRMFANVTQEYAFRVVDPALPPDSDTPLRPKKLLMFALGPLVGFSLGAIGVLAWELLFAKRKRPAK